MLSLSFFATYLSTAGSTLAKVPTAPEIAHVEISLIESFNVFLDEKSLPYLEDAKVDYHPDKFGGQLTIRAPKSKTPFLSDESSIEDKINFYLHSEINPALASHGGEVSQVEVLDDNKAVLQFGGGCQGCSMIDVTLKDGVEKTLIENVPEITGIIDSTDHSHTENAYFK